MPQDAPWPNRALADGDLVRLAASPDEGDWRTWAARALAAVPGAAKALERFAGDEARLARAAALYIAGRIDEAREVASGLSGETAERLRARLASPRLDVVAFLPWPAAAPHGLALAGAADPTIRIHTVSCREGSAIRNRPFATLDALLPSGLRPDLIVAEMLEWHLLPADLDRAPCPVVGVTADFDIHIQAVWDWLPRFDLLVVTDSSEWEELRPLCDRPVLTFPKVFGVEDRLPPPPEGERPTDVFFSGSVFHPYHPDKARLVQELLADRELVVELRDGFLSRRGYRERLARAKTSFTYIRHPGAMPTRALEALAMGCAVAVQQGSSLALYLGPEDGLLTYGPEPGDLARTLRAAARDPRLSQRARRGAERVRRIFGMPRVAGEFFRAMALFASLLPERRSARPSRVAVPRRTVLTWGWIPSGASHEDLKRLAREHVARLPARVAAGDGARATAEAVRELVLELASVAHAAGPRRWCRRFAPQALALLGRLVDAEPENLVHRFNFVRVALHYGRLADIGRALRLAEETLARGPGGWRADPLDDLYPWDFFPSHVNYRGCLDEATRILAGRGDPGKLAALILASLADYAGLARGETARHEQAVALDPEFPFFRFNLASALVRDGERRRAAEILGPLARETILLRPAARALEEIAGGTPESAELAWRCARAPEGGIGSTVELEGRSCDLPDLPRIAARALPPPRSFGDPPAPAGVERLVVPEGHERLDYDVSAVVSVWRAGRFIDGLLDDLLRQSLGERLEIVVIDSASPEGEGEAVLARMRRHPNIVYLRTEARETSHAAFARAAGLARGRYLALANTDDRHHPEALERMARVLDARPDVALAYADFWVTQRENALFEQQPFEKRQELEEFTLHDLLRHCPVGPQPVWRRALHDRHGTFDPGLDSAGDWEMWLRFAREEVFLHVPETLGVYYYSPSSCERRDPELAERERRHIVRSYAWLGTEEVARRRNARIAAPRLDETLVLIVRGADPAPASRSVAALRAERPRARDLRYAVVRERPEDPDVPGGPATDPPSFTLAELLCDGWPWRYRHVLLVPAGVARSARRLEAIGEELERDDRTGALRLPDGLIALRSRAVLDAAEEAARADGRPDRLLAALSARGWKIGRPGERACAS